jgi:hypothetical protein
LLILNLSDASAGREAILSAACSWRGQFSLQLSLELEGELVAADTGQWEKRWAHNQFTATMGQIMPAQTLYSYAAVM